MCRSVARRVAALGCIVLLTVVVASDLRAQTPIRNPGFEEGDVSAPPIGWQVTARPPYTVTLATEGSHAGSRAALIDGPSAPRDGIGNLFQAVDATTFRGKRVRFSGFVRVVNPGADGAIGLWIQVVRVGGRIAYIGTMQGRWIIDSEWRRYSLIADVAPDAERILIGAAVQGAGRAWVDDLALDTLGSPRPPEPARALSSSGLTNLVAFTRLLGYIRFFHPSDAAAVTDWNSFAIAGVRAVESAEGATRLAAVLDSLFRPIAPSLVVAAGTPARMLAAPPRAGLDIVAWHHVGVGLKNGAPYHSERMRVSAAIPLPDSVPDPLTPFVAELGGGLKVSVPLAVYADAAGTLPRSPTVRNGDTEDRLTAGAYTANDRAVRLADVALTWTILQHFYPYFDVVQADWRAELPRALRSAATDTDAVAFSSTLYRLTAALHDGHGRASRPEDLDRAWQPPLKLRSVEGKVVVAAVGEGGSPARLGDVVLALDGTPIEVALARAEELVSAATPQFRHVRALGAIAGGARDTELRLTLRHLDGTTEPVLLRRSLRAGSALRERRPEVVAEIRPGIWYVDLDRATDADVAAAIPKLAVARGIVLDMRGYPGQVEPLTLLGHLTRNPMRMPGIYLPVVSRPDREGMRFVRQSAEFPPVEPFLAARCAFLLDARAFSKAESLLGLVETNHLGALVGEPTAGTNGNINPIALPGGYTVYWTGMKVTKYDGSQHHGVGILPTVPVAPTIAGIAAGRDEQLERAIQVVDH